MANDCPRGGQHTGGSPQREGSQTVIRCTKCGQVIARGELPE